MKIKTEILRTTNAGKEGSSYGWDIGINFNCRRISFSFTMRDLIHWSAYLLDTGPDGYITNHRAAVVLRSIAEDFYPYSEDQADYIIEELQDAGCTEDLKFDEPRCPTVDSRLLDLHDGFISIDGSLDETDPNYEELDPLLVASINNTVDFPFPAAAVERYGVAGLRIPVLKLINWMQADAWLQTMSFKDETSWLDELENALRSSRNATEADFSRRMRFRHGEDWEERLSQPD